MNRALLAVSVVAIQVAALAQASFEVASVKVNPTAERRGLNSISFFADRFSAQRTTARALILAAHDLKGFQVAGGPSWITSDLFDVEAKAGKPVAAKELREMLQALLAHRFKLTLRRESRDLDGFVLTQPRAGSTGRGLRVSSEDCLGRDKDTPHCREGVFGSVGADSPVARIRMFGVPMRFLVDQITSAQRAPVVDETSLAGMFDIELQWSTALAPTGDVPSLSTAVQEQLGLRLERSRVPTQILIIDSIEHPTPD